MKKKLLAAVMSVCLIAVVGVGATLAYYTSQTDEVVNTFTIGNVDITVEEPTWNPEDGKNLVPGAEVAKNPVIVNTGSSAGYMMLKVDGMAEMAAMGFSAMNGDVAGYNTADWTLVDKDGNKLASDGTLVDGYYVYKESVATGASTSPLFTAIKFAEDAEEYNAQYQVVGKVQKDADGNTVVDAEGNPIVKYTIAGAENQVFDTYEDAENFVLANYKNDATFVFDLKVQGYAIQSDNIDYQTEGTYTWVKEFALN